MFLAVAIGLLAGILGGFIADYLSNKFLNKQGPDSKISVGTDKKSEYRQKTGKRRPRVLTDSMAYLKELEEEGQNRG